MKIVHLYYNLMNLYGEYGNVLALKRALEEKGEKAEIVKLSVGDEFDFSECGLIYIGSGTERSQKAALEYIAPYRDEIYNAWKGGADILATGNAFEMFGEKITDADGKEHKGLGFFDFVTLEGSKRIVTDSLCEFENHEIIGFVNKASQIFGIEKPFFAVKQGAGNSDSETANEGIKTDGFYGTHIIGPLLVRNQYMAEYFANQLISNS